MNEVEWSVALGPPGETRHKSSHRKCGRQQYSLYSLTALRQTTLKIIEAIQQITRLSLLSLLFNYICYLVPLLRY